MQARTRDFIEDVEWLVTTGETNADAVAARLSSAPLVIKRRLERHGRNDLIGRIQRGTSEGRTL